MQADDAVNSWQQWDVRLHSRPTILAPLSGGRSNRSFLLDSDIGKLVLRLNGTDSLLPGSTRNYESQIWQAASERGIAPPLVYIDEQQGYLISTWIDSIPSVQSTNGGKYSNQVIELLKRCHQLQVDAPMIDYSDHIERYWGNIEDSGQLADPALIKQREPMHLLLATLINSGTTTGLCHHDPVVANFVGDADRLYLIDWEYAATGLLVMDYAALSVEWGIDEARVSAQTGLEPELLHMAKTLYGYICDLWEEQNGPRVEPGVTVDTPSFQS